MRRQGFSQKLQRLEKQIRANGCLSIGEACGLLEFGPWQVERYAKILTQQFPEIQYDKEHGFKALVFKLSPNQSLLDTHTNTHTSKNLT